VTVTVTDPIFVCFFVVTNNVELPDPAIVAGLRVAVTNFGNAPTESDTALLNPFADAIAIEYVALLPFCTVWVAGVAVIVKSPIGVTFSVTLAVRDTGPLVPRIVSGYEPAGVVGLVVTVSALEPEVGMLAVANVAVAPAGNTLTTLNATVPVNPERAATVAVYPAFDPCTTLRDDGVADTEKSETVIDRVAAALVSPPLSVTCRLAW
jgi:hypothetical protein